MRSRVPYDAKRRTTPHSDKQSNTVNTNKIKSKRFYSLIQIDVHFETLKIYWKSLQRISVPIKNRFRFTVNYLICSDNSLREGVSKATEGDRKRCKQDGLTVQRKFILTLLLLGPLK